MIQSIEEDYSKEGKNLTELIQEWINENYLFSHCLLDRKNVKSNCR